MKGHFDKAGVPAKRYVREFKFENVSDYALGNEIKADIFEAGDKIDASAVSKGKGFQGAIKRHGQHRGPMAHGSKFHRHQGSNGACSSPSRVFKGKGMPGHMGCETVTVRNLEVVEINVTGYNFPTCIFTAEQAAQIFKLETLSQINTSVEWQQSLILQGVYDADTRAAFFEVYPLERPSGAI